MTLQRIVELYKKCWKHCSDDEFTWFNQQPSLDKAIELAAFAFDEHRKRYPHQRKIRRDSLNRAYPKLQASKTKIERCKDFDTLFGVIQESVADISGIGELYIYDTVFRIGAKLNLQPDKVYLHSGTREGAKKLHLDFKAKALELSQFPEELQKLQANEIEDILCIYKDKFQ